MAAPTIDKRVRALPLNASGNVTQTISNANSEQQYFREAYSVDLSTLAGLTAASTVALGNIPANAQVKDVYLNVKTASTGGTAPTVGVTDSNGGVLFVAQTTLGAQGTTKGAGASIGKKYAANDHIQLTFGGTLGTGGVVEVWVDFVRN